MRRRIDQAAVVRITWLVTGLVLLGVGGGMVWWPAASEITQERGRALDLYEQANALDAQTRRAEELRRAQHRIELDLHELEGASSEAQTTSNALLLLSNEAKHNRLDIRDIAPDSDGASPTVAPEPTDDTLTGADVSIDVRGNFRDIVAFMTDLPRHDVLVEIHHVELRATGAMRPLPILDATVHATIYHLVSRSLRENTDVRALR